jgi:hypothetical protein
LKIGFILPELLLDPKNRKIPSIIRVVGFEDIVSGTKMQGLEHRSTILEVMFRSDFLFFFQNILNFGT